ncbi:hypothetical protein EBO34_04310 [Alteribacter keqinensis]|uniref:Uncharacterized protein n=1 Tax=Alteribacter keqinensis TaxID=2483800 RepID=A0A3M7TU76_9BACI|nr:hypothetical protein EBO34_04310 [Alteribacter keqinensis]
MIIAVKLSFLDGFFWFPSFFLFIHFPKYPYFPAAYFEKRYSRNVSRLLGEVGWERPEQEAYEPPAESAMSANQQAFNSLKNIKI